MSSLSNFLFKVKYFASNKQNREVVINLCFNDLNVLQLNFREFIYQDPKVHPFWLCKMKTWVLDRKTDTFPEPVFVFERVAL